MSDDALIEAMARDIAPTVTDKSWSCECTAERGDDCDCGDALSDDKVDQYDEDWCKNDIRRICRAALAAIRKTHAVVSSVARPGEEYHEDMGNMLWWRFPIDEPPYAGMPGDCDWPGYHTHFTPIPMPLSAGENHDDQ